MKVGGTASLYSSWKPHTCLVEPSASFPGGPWHISSGCVVGLPEEEPLESGSACWPARRGWTAGTSQLLNVIEPTSLEEARAAFSLPDALNSTPHVGFSLEVPRMTFYTIQFTLLGCGDPGVVEDEEVGGCV